MPTCVVAREQRAEGTGGESVGQAGWRSVFGSWSLPAALGLPQAVDQNDQTRGSLRKSEGKRDGIQTDHHACDVPKTHIDAH